MARGSGKDPREAFAFDRLRFKSRVEDPNVAPPKHHCELYFKDDKLFKICSDGTTLSYDDALSSLFGLSPLAVFGSTANAVNNKFLNNISGATSDQVGEIVPKDATLVQVTFSNRTAGASGTLEFRINTAVGPATFSVTLTGAKKETFSINFAASQLDDINCKVVSASGVSKPVVKVYA